MNVPACLFSLAAVLLLATPGFSQLVNYELVPVGDPVAKRRLIAMLETYLRDNVKSAELQSDGSLVRLKAGDKSGRLRSQEVLYQKAVAAVRQAEQSRRVVFQPHRAPDSQL